MVGRRKEDRLHEEVKPYVTFRNNLSVHQAIWFYQDCIVIPQNLRAEILRAIHARHLGLNRC